jgi:hypothetical protein
MAASRPFSSLWMMVCLSFVASLGLAKNTSSQSQSGGLTSPGSPSRDTEAVALMQGALKALGGSVPADSVATGTVSIVAGTKTDSGTIRILTRGTDQTSEQIQLEDGTVDAVVYSKGQANEVVHGTVNPASLELASSNQSSDYPLPLLAAAFNNPDCSFQYVGQETLEDGSTAHHIRFWNTYASNQGMRPLSEFSIKDLWVSATTGLPQKLTYLRREAGGSVPRMALGISYSDWRNVGGVMYPFQIQKSWNGTPWTTITIQNVAFQTGLTDNDFPISSPATQTTAQNGVQP